VNDGDLLGVSCTLATACGAVGRYPNGRGTFLTLAKAWNGIDWTIIDPTTRPS
jgi:hypothetical protein